jgi:hypothetical protein
MFLESTAHCPLKKCNLQGNMLLQDTPSKSLNLRNLDTSLQGKKRTWGAVQSNMIQMDTTSVRKMLPCLRYSQEGQKSYQYLKH